MSSLKYSISFRSENIKLKQHHIPIYWTIDKDTFRRDRGLKMLWKPLRFKSLRLCAQLLFTYHVGDSLEVRVHVFCERNRIWVLNSNELPGQFPNVYCFLNQSPDKAQPCYQLRIVLLNIGTPKVQYMDAQPSEVHKKTRVAS